MGSVKHISYKELICPSCFKLTILRIYLQNPSTHLTWQSLIQVDLPYCVPSSLITLTNGAGIFSLLSIAYSNWPRLRCRLTLSGWSDLTETLDFRWTGISPVFSLLMPTFSLLWSTINLSLQLSLYLSENAPLPLHLLKGANRDFGSLFKTRSFFSAKILGQWAVTLSLKDGCFQANLLAVYAFSHL